MTHPLETVEIHPLFPIDSDDPDEEAITVSSIHIARKENGKLFFAPRPRSASELQSIEQVHSEFGGGEYTLVAYNNGRISGRRVYNLGGKSKPLFDEGNDTPSLATPVAAASQVLDPMSQLMGQGGGGVMGLIMMMMQQMMQQQAASQQQQMQLFMTMMQSGGERSKEDKEEQRRLYHENIERERLSSERQMAMLREMMVNRPSGSGEEFHKGVEFMRGFATMQIEQIKSTAKDGGDSDFSQLLETGLQALQGVIALKEMSNPTPAAVPQAAQ